MSLLQAEGSTVHLPLQPLLVGPHTLHLWHWYEHDGTGDLTVNLANSTTDNLPAADSTNLFTTDGRTRTHFMHMVQALPLMDLVV